MANKLEQYQDELKDLVAQAQAALGQKNVEEATRLRKKAESVKAIIAEYRTLSDMKPFANGENGNGNGNDKTQSPARPPVPMNQNGGGQFTSMESDKSAAGDDDGESVDINHAAYMMKFGTTEKAVQAILRDMYGPDYTQQYWSNRALFRKFLRVGPDEMDSKERKALKTIIITPQVVQQTLLEGLDSVKYMKDTLVSAIDELGGYGVPVDFRNTVIEKLQGFTVVRGRAQVDSTSRDMVEIPVGTGGDDQHTSAVRVTWVDETPEPGKSETNPTFGMESIPIFTVMAETWLSRNQVEDNAFDIEGYLARKFGEAAAIDEDNRFLLGSGNGTPEGWLPGGTNAANLSERLSGSDTGILWNNIVSLMFAVPSQYRANAVWIANRFTYEHIATIQDDTSGNYLWQPYQFAGGAAAQPMTLLGFPVLEQEIMPAIATGSYPLLFGDMGGYQIIDRIGMTIERYLDSNTATRNQIMYVMRRRLGGQPTQGL